MACGNPEWSKILTHPETHPIWSHTMSNRPLIPPNSMHEYFFITHNCLLQHTLQFACCSLQATYDRCLWSKIFIHPETHPIGSHTMSNRPLIPPSSIHEYFFITHNCLLQHTLQFACCLLQATYDRCLWSKILTHPETHPIWSHTMSNRPLIPPSSMHEYFLPTHKLPVAALHTACRLLQTNCDL